MKTSYHIESKAAKIKRRINLLPVLLLTFMAIVSSLDRAIAQRNNLSDWNVPPPLPPGVTTKGNTTGRSATSKPVILTITDIPAASQPVATTAQTADLPPVSTTPPAVNIPSQPALSAIGSGLPDIPSPAGPDAPAMPQRSLQDALVSAVVDVPVPELPEMPAPPAQPTSSGQTIPSKSAVPLMPDIVSLPPVTVQPGGIITAWSSPGIPENISFKLVITKH